MSTRNFVYKGSTIRVVPEGPDRMVVHDQDARMSVTCYVSDGFSAPERREWMGILHPRGDEHTLLGMQADSSARDVARAAAEILFGLDLEKRGIVRR